jgi:ferritin-like metal-binding protein YciE
VRQIKTFAEWAEINHSRSFRNFLSEQQKLALQQRSDLKALESVLGIFLSGATCHPVQGFLNEAEKVIRFPENDIDITESVTAQLIQCVKHYELVTYQAALTIARNLKEQKVVSKLTKIVLEEEQAYLNLQNFITSRRQNAVSASF